MLNKRRSWLLVLVVMLFFLAAGCGSGNSGSQDDQEDVTDTLGLETLEDAGPVDVPSPEDSAGEADSSASDSGDEKDVFQQEGPQDTGDSDTYKPDNVMTKVIGQSGGEIKVGDSALLAVPAGVLPGDTTISVVLHHEVGGEAPVPPIGGWVEITLDPEPQGPLPKAALLTFFESGQGGPGTIARMVALPTPGSTLGDDGVELPAEAWVPLKWTRSDEAGNPAVALAGFSSYGASGTPPPECIPTQEQLAVPPTPDGFEYAGVKVIINGWMDPLLSTLPPLFPPSWVGPMNILSSSSTMEDGVVVCHIVVSHEFIPEGSMDLDCIPSSNLLNCPPPDDGRGFVGYDLVVNGQLANSTIPLDRPEWHTDLNLIRSETEMVDGMVACDYIARCLYCEAACCQTADAGFTSMCPEHCIAEGGTPLPAEDCPACCLTETGDTTTMTGSDCVDGGGIPVPDEACDEVCCEIDAETYLTMPQGTCTYLVGSSHVADQCDEICCAQGGTELSIMYESACIQGQGTPWPGSGGCPCPDGHEVVSAGVSVGFTGKPSDGYFFAEQGSFLGELNGTCFINGDKSQPGQIQMEDGVLVFTPGAGCREEGTGCLLCQECPAGTKVPLTFINDWYYTGTCGGYTVLFQHGCQALTTCCLMPSGEKLYYSEQTCIMLGGETLSWKWCNEICCELDGAWVKTSEAECNATGGTYVANSYYCSDACCEVAQGQFEISTPNDCKPPMQLAPEYKCLLP